METGVYGDISAEVYHSGPEISVSRLKQFATPGGPARVRFGQHKETDAMRFGSLIHAAVLEPEMFDRMYMATDAERRGTKAWEAAEAAAAGRIVVKRAEFDEAQRIRDSVMGTRLGQQLINHNIKTEQSFFWIDDETGLPCRGRADGLRDDWNTIVDVKSCINASPEEVRWTMLKMRYSWQESHYRKGLERTGWGKANGFIFIFVEKTEPYLCGFYELDMNDIKRGDIEVQAALHAYKKCVDADQWPGLSDEIERVELPSSMRYAATLEHEMAA